MSALNIECWAILSKVRSFISDCRRMLDWWNELIAPQSMQIEGPKNVPISFLLKMSLRHLLLDKANVSGSIPRSISNLQSLELEATTRPNHWNSNIGQSKLMGLTEGSVHPYFGSPIVLRRNLQSAKFDLGRNSITGVIPSFLSSLVHLKF